MVGRVLVTPQASDPGTEGIVGYDYQRDLATQLCINMLADKDMEYVVCEFHEDVVQIRKGLRLELIQVKKNQARSWTLHSIIAPVKRQRKGVLAKLFTPLQVGKDVIRLGFWGHARVGTSKDDGEFSLAELIALTKMPEEGRDDDWKSRLQEYSDYLSYKLQPQDISADTVKKALDLLDINFDFPHPDAIENECRRLLGETLRSMWSVELSLSEIETVYRDLYARVKMVSRKPNQHWAVKAISRGDVIDIVLKHLREFTPSASREATMTTQDKLTCVGMGSKARYAFCKRLNAMVLRYELNINSAQWEDHRTDIDRECRRLRESHPTCKGPDLWSGLRQIFADLGQSWTKQQKDVRLNCDFAEGVFFDMTGICEASWMRAGT